MVFCAGYNRLERPDPKRRSMWRWLASEAWELRQRGNAWGSLSSEKGP